MSNRMTAGEAFYLNRLGNSNYCVPWRLLLPDIKEEFERDADRVLQNAAAIRGRMGEGWQPISTGPGEETVILWDGRETFPGHYDTGRCAWYHEDGAKCEPRPTHWHTLPEPPQ